jgi:hypothetical protein
MRALSPRLWLPLLALTSAACTSSAPGPVRCGTTEDCPVDGVCTEGLCVGCAHCAEGETCLRGTCAQKNCGDLPCKTRQACLEGTCSDDLCLKVFCGRGEVCARGVCYPAECETRPCDPGQVCVDDQCVYGTCVGVSCADGQLCVDGRCRSQNCPGQRCADNAACVEGQCKPIDCVGARCPEGTACAQGKCVSTTCADTVCAEGEVCLLNACIPAGCLGLDCGPDERCLDGACGECAASEVSCTDGQDDDCDGFTDCEDTDCDTRACSDLNACTTGDVCGAGKCNAGAAVVCGAPTDACHGTPGTCAPGTGLCTYPPKPAQTRCDDLNACTLEDLCDDSGSCVGASLRVCNTPPRACDVAEGTCNPTNGQCAYALKPTGSTCENPSACFSGGSCDGAGNCVGGMPGTCAPPTNPCMQPAATCDALRGCLYTPQPAGILCSDKNECTVGDACDGSGVCVGGKAKVCNTPGSSCKSSLGTCSPATGVCSYANKTSGTSCEDGNGCTLGDKCNSTGSCVGGAVCPSNGNPCQAGQCTSGSCQYVDRADAIKCGSTASKRCCSGTCVDISTNESHCGGCFTACKNGNACESVSATSGCSPSPASTSGRCRCKGATADCSRGQICRAGQSSYNDRCTPSSSANCHGKFVDVSFCPNYCAY